jgi:heat shock transcription factor
MYGFHKKVGLNANSMKAAEKKVKDPSVYWHEYFKRGRPDLLWLIQKPAAKSSGSKRKRDQEKREPGDSDDEHKNSPEAGDATAALMTTMPRQDMGTFRTELQNLKRQQSVISKMITSLKDQNEQFYRQATAFQALHDRHENSINAILTFLATFYNRSLDGHSGPPNLASFLSSASIPQQAQQQGSVFDMGDGDMNDSNANNTNHQQLQRYQTRPLLLPAPGAQTLSPSPFSNVSPSVRSSTSPGPAQQGPHPTQYGPHPPQQRPHQPQRPQRASVTPVIKDDAPTPDFVNQYPENDDVMNLIRNVNASNSPNNGGVAGNYDINTALDHLQAVNSNSTLTPQERDEMLAMIASSGATGAGATAAQPGANNALMMPNPPVMPSLEVLRQNNAQLEMLTKMQQEQDSKVADLAGRLQPLSPTGAIPGINANNFEELGNPGDFDLGTYLNETEDGYFGTFDTTSAAQQSTYPTTSAPPQGINDDLGFNWGDYPTANGMADADDLFGEGGASGINDGGLGIDERGGRVVGSVSSAGTSPPDATKVTGDDDETPSKKRKMGN